MRVVFGDGLEFEGELRVGNHHYARLFKRDGHQVSWITSPVSPFHLISLMYNKSNKKKEHRRRFNLWFSNGSMADGVFQYCPLTLLPYTNRPFFRSRLVLDHSFDLCVPNIEKVALRHGFLEPDVLWISPPFFVSLYEKLRPKILVYRAADDWSGFKFMPSTISIAENKVLQLADIVFTTSIVQKQKLSKVRGDVIYIPNGADVANFSKQTQKPPEYSALVGPIAVYVGAIDTYFDTTMLKVAAESLPNWNFVLIGPQKIDIGSLAGLNNVFLMGPRPYEQLGAYLQWATVGIIPFRRCQLVESICPVKVYEYLVAGLPTVATRWLELELAELPISLVDTTDQFCSALEENANGNERLRHERIQFGRANSWEKRYEDILHSIRFKGLPG